MVAAGRRSVLALALILACPAPAAAQMRATAARPPPLEVTAPECEIWKGKVSGNDPSVEAEVRFCGSGDQVNGVFQWSSLTSGWNRRALEGTWSEGRSRLILHDTKIVEQRPEPGWRFCTVDEYELRLVSPGVLEGKYRSKACNDNATLKLERVASGPSASSGATPASAPPSSPPPPPPTPPTPEPTTPPPAAKESGGICSVGWGTHPSAPARWVLVTAAALALAARRRRSRRLSGSQRARGA